MYEERMRSNDAALYIPFHYRIYSENHRYEDFASFSVTFEGKNYLIHRYE